MPIAVNTTNMSSIKLGSTEIIRVYLGTSIVYESQKPNIFKFKVTAGQTLTLQNDTRGAYAMDTDWGDGTKNTSLTHTYSTAGTYTVSTVYSVATSTIPNGYSRPTYDENTALSLIEVSQICDKITNINYMFYNCRRLAMSKINVSTIDPSKFSAAKGTFEYCGYNADLA